MSFSFSGSSTYVEGASAPVTAPPLTMAIWANPSDVATANYVMTLGSTSAHNAFRLGIRGDVVGDPLEILTIVGGTFGFARVGTVTTGSWQHMCAVVSADNSRTAYLNGTAGTPETTNVTGTAPDRLEIGCTINTGVRGGHFTGGLAEPAIWNVALGQDEITSLSKGISPLKIRPQSLVFYARLVRQLLDLRSGLSLSFSAGVTAADHLRMFR